MYKYTLYMYVMNRVFFLILDALRRRVWPKLLGLDTKAATELPTQKEIESHAEYLQVVLDVNRSLKRFPPGKIDN